MKEDFYEYFVDAVQQDCRCSRDDAEELAVDFAIDFAKMTDWNDVNSQYDAWKQLVDEFMLGVEVEKLTKIHDAELLFNDIIETCKVAIQ